MLGFHQFGTFRTDAALDRLWDGEHPSASSAFPFVLELVAGGEFLAVPDDAQSPSDDANRGAVLCELAVAGESYRPFGRVEHAHVGVVAGVIWSGEEGDEPRRGVGSAGLFVGHAERVTLAFAIRHGEAGLASGDEVACDHWSWSFRF